MKLHIILFFFTVWTSFACQAQDENRNEDGAKGNHRVTLGLSHANVSQGITESGSKWLSLPAWGLDYDYWISDRWAIGLHTDIIVESFEVKENLSSENETIERTKPVAPAIMGIYQATKHSSILLGAGMEFAKEDDLFLNRVGYEWGTEITQEWELSLSLCYDLRWNAYDSFLLGIGVSKVFRNNRK